MKYHDSFESEGHPRRPEADELGIMHLVIAIRTYSGANLMLWSCCWSLSEEIDRPSDRRSSLRVLSNLARLLQIAGGAIRLLHRIATHLVQHSKVQRVPGY